VLHHLVAVPATAARTLPEFGGGTGDHPIEDDPGGPQQRDAAAGLGSGQRFMVVLGDLAGDAELGAPIAGQALDDRQGVRQAGPEADLRLGGDERVPGRVVGECRQRGLLALAGSAPARPVHGCREDFSFANFQYDVHARILRQKCGAGHVLPVTGPHQ
jgi:hypothetical protein